MGETAMTFPRDAGEIIRERLKASFLEMMPDDTLDQLIRKQWEEFFQPKAKDERKPSWGYSQRDREAEESISPFVLMVRNILRDTAAEKIKSLLNDEMNATMWNNYDKGEVLAKIVKEAGPSIWRGAMSSFVDLVVQNALQDAANRARGY